MPRSDGLSPDFHPSRRVLISVGPLVLAAAALPRSALASVTMVMIENFAPSGKSVGFVQLPKLVKTEAEWRKLLSPESFEVTRHADTEPPWTGVYWNNHTDGLYRCVCCDTALFDSRTKFESGTGWPSFWQPIAKMNVRENTDSSFGMKRTAISCSRCDAHLGHVFDDGPRPTGLRYCMNSAALRFIKRA